MIGDIPMMPRRRPVSTAAPGVLSGGVTEYGVAGGVCFAVAAKSSGCVAPLRTKSPRRENFRNRRGPRPLGKHLQQISPRGHHVSPCKEAHVHRSR